MKRQLACVLAACIGLQLPLAPLTPMERSCRNQQGKWKPWRKAKSPVWNQTAGTRKRRLRKQRKKRFPTASSSESHRQEDEEDGGTETESVPLQVPVSR